MPLFSYTDNSDAARYAEAGEKRIVVIPGWMMHGWNPGERLGVLTGGTANLLAAGFGIS